MIIPNSGSVTALPVFLGKLVVFLWAPISYSLFSFYNLLPYTDSVFINAVVESGGDLQSMHDVGERFLREAAAERVIAIPLIVENDLYVIPPFQFYRHGRQCFLPEDQFVRYPRCFRDRAVGLVRFYRTALETDWGGGFSGGYGVRGVCGCDLTAHGDRKLFIWVEEDSGSCVSRDIDFDLSVY